MHKKGELMQVNLAMRCPVDQKPVTMSFQQAKLEDQLELGDIELRCDRCQHMGKAEEKERAQIASFIGRQEHRLTAKSLADKQVE
jgi:hypothetical protein